ncbi:MAG TPA: cytochrome c peroxidase [Cytophagaceae bacterium]|nr:cytochrome c peroxidase [Cytophagaceae bacterium]
MKKALLIGLSILFLFLAFTREQVPAGPYELHYPVYFGNRLNISPANPLTKEGVYLGRKLFYEKRLSINNAVSCGTCHEQQHAFTDAKQFSMGVGKQPTSRNSMSLANLLWVRSFFWDGRATSLEEQGKEPILHADEMGETLEHVSAKLQQTREYPKLFKLVYGNDSITGDRIVQAIAQFERTLISANSPYDQYLQGKYTPTEKEQRGMTLFMTHPDPEKNVRGANCVHCHAAPKMFADLFHNNGLDSLPKDKGREKITGLPNDRGRFRAVSLRNSALTAPYMHDGRFRTLEEVLDHYSEHIQSSTTLSPFLQDASNEPGAKSIRLSAKEKEELIAFLQMLTDSSFITDPRFSDPYKTEIRK